MVSFAGVLGATAQVRRQKAIWQSRETVVILMLAGLQRSVCGQEMGKIPVRIIT